MISEVDAKASPGATGVPKRPTLVGKRERVSTMKSTLRPSASPVLHVARAARKFDRSLVRGVFSPLSMEGVFGHRHYGWSPEAWAAMVAAQPVLGLLPQYAVKGGTMPETLPEPLRLAVLRRASARRHSDADNVPRAVRALLQYARGAKRGAL